MSIIVSNLSFHYPNHNNLLHRINLSVDNQSKLAIVGNNGSGKSTLLKLIAGQLLPSEGSIVCSSQPYYIPQHTGQLNITVAEALRVHHKLAALHAITEGSISQSDYDVLGDDWDIESRCMAALSYWNLLHLTTDTPMDSLSGGEISRVFLAGLNIHSPETVLLDEPTNHIDRSGRQLLYRFIEQSRSAMIVVSHDISLLNRMNATGELSSLGLKMYGGNYEFYAAQKEIEKNALSQSIHEQEKSLQLARRQAQEIKQRQDRRTASQGKKNATQVPRIMKNTLRNSAENTASRLKDKHAEIIGEGRSKLSELRQQQEQLKSLKIDLGQATVRHSKLLVEAEAINFGYSADALLWNNDIDFSLYGNDRIHLLGDNGSGKTTLVKLIIGDIEPSCGVIKRTEFSSICLDQNYTQVEVGETIEQLAMIYNVNNLPEHEVRLRLNRFLFAPDTWKKSCNDLSGGEKMRLCLCCLMIGNQTPDLIILDEPTNNIDIASRQILIETMKGYNGSVVVISHDDYFVNEIGITSTVELVRSSTIL